MENVTREFGDVSDEFMVLYDDAADEYNVIDIKNEFCVLNTKEWDDVFEFFNYLYIEF